MAISSLKFVVGDIHLGKITVLSFFPFFFHEGKTEGDFSTCAEWRTFPGENCCVGSVFRRNCVIKTTGFTLLKKLLMLGKALENGLENVAGKGHFQAAALLPFSIFPISPLLLRAHVDT